MLWCRLYKEFATDPKVQRLPECMQRRLIMLMCLHIDNEIEKLSDDDISFILKLSKQELKKTATALRKFLTAEGSWKLLRWEARQFVSDSSKARVARHRQKVKRSCNVTSPLQKRYSNGLDTDTDTDTDTERDINNCSSSITVTTPAKESAAAAPTFSNFDYLQELEKWFPTLNPLNPKLFRMFAVWQKAGVIRIDIVCAMECKMPERTEIKVPWFFEKIVVDFANARIAGKSLPVSFRTNEQRMKEYLAKTEAECAAVGNKL